MVHTYRRKTSVKRYFHLVQESKRCQMTRSLQLSVDLNKIRALLNQCHETVEDEFVYRERRRESDSWQWFTIQPSKRHFPPRSFPLKTSFSNPFVLSVRIAGLLFWLLLLIRPISVACSLIVLLVSVLPNFWITFVTFAWQHSWWYAILLPKPRTQISPIFDALILSDVSHHVSPDF